VAAAVTTVMTTWTPDDAGGAATAMIAAAKTAYTNDMKATSSTDISDALALLEAFDDISIVAAPGLTGRTVWGNLQDHCTKNAPNRFAILDAPADADWATSKPTELPDANSSSAIYYPWIQVSDPVTRTIKAVPPSGHVAGIYARVDAQRGVFKAPANEPVLGALDLTALVSDRQQAPLNDDGTCVNCIRRLNGNILVWGARTVGWSNASPIADAPFKYLSTRRTYNYIRLSLQQGTQWAVFEPNTQVLWGKIVRNVTSFLTKLWQSGGLFGATAAEAFYVKCDEETNPPENRQNGMVTTEVGVAITQPAEFVIFNLGVMTGDSSASS
jgi:phage tail sheath protein FI